MTSDTHIAVDFNEPVELFSDRAKAARAEYRHFASLQAAVAFSIEKMPSPQFKGAAIETRDTRHAAQEIKTLYERPDYPRKAAAQ